MTLNVELWERHHVGTPGPPTIVTIGGASAMPETWGRQFRNAKNDYGFARTNLQLSASAAVEASTSGRLLKFRRDGVVRGGCVLTERDYRTVQRGGGAAKVLQLGGKGFLSVLDDGKVGPQGGTDWSPWDRQRPWNWSNPYLDFSALGAVAATELWQQGTVGDPSLTSSTPPQMFRDQGRFAWAPPEGFFDGTAWWIWSSTYTGSPGTAGSGTLHIPPGVSYFHKTFTVAADTRARVVGGADDYMEAAIDGVILFSTPPYPGEAHDRATTRDLLLSAGTHTVRVKVENFVRDSVGNIGALVLAIHEVDGSTGVPTDVLVHTDDTWLALDYPATPPGFTAGDILLRHLAEQQAAGFLLDVVPTFTATLASDGTAFPILTDVVTTVGRGLGETAREMAKSSIDTQVNHDMTWDAWVKGTHGTASGVTYAPGVNIAELGYDGGLPPVSSLLVLCQGLPFVLGDATQGRQEFLDLSSLSDAEARERGQAELDELASERWQLNLAALPAGGDVPMEDVDIFDTATVPDPYGASAVVECVATLYGEDPRTGAEILGASFGDVVLSAAERKERDRRRAAFGGLDGRTLLVPPASGGTSPAPTPLGQGGGTFGEVVRTVEFPFHRNEGDTDTESDPWPAGAARTIFEFAAVIPAQGTSTSVSLNVNGTPVSTVVIAAGDTYGQEPGLSVALTKDTDLITVSCATTGFSIVAVARAA